MESLFSNTLFERAEREMITSNEQYEMHRFHSDYCRALEEQGRADDTLDQSQFSVALSPNSAEVHKCLADALLTVNQQNETQSRLHAATVSAHDPILRTTFDYAWLGERPYVKNSLFNLNFLTSQQDYNNLETAEYVENSDCRTSISRIVNEINEFLRRNEKSKCKDFVERQLFDIRSKKCHDLQKNFIQSLIIPQKYIDRRGGILGVHFEVERLNFGFGVDSKSGSIRITFVYWKK